jgi:hypothetical protein
VLKESVALFCKSCKKIVYEKALGRARPQASEPPPDWSFIQLNTTGDHNQQPFTVIGRIRLQLRNEYKNFWCVALEDGASLWLMESFASFAIFPAVWHNYTNSVTDVRAGNTINVQKGLKLRGEYVEKCEGITYEGEIGSWKLFEPGFFVVQAANSQNEIALFTIMDKKDVDYLGGVKIQSESLSLKNIIVWDEWK